MEEKKAFQRLPKDVVPKNYAVELTPDLKAFTFGGKLRIDAEVVTSTSRVVLNSSEITIISASAEVPGAFSQNATVSFSAEEETVTFEFSSALPKGEVTLHVHYTGILNDQLKGFYRSKYFHPSHPEEERYMAVTQFESTDARKALPCWDEPAIKATFDVTLVVPRHLTALSNMNAVDSKEEGELKRVTFAQSPIMSTYLLAFIVGEFDYVEEKDVNGLLVRVYTPVGKAEQGRFALEVAVKTMPFYKDYFNVSYPLPKLDLIAIADFAAGAMENWGLVTYRERVLLVDKNTPLTTKQYVALVVGHELAHQWFGNLVTMEWWTHLWLNEGFATWIEYLCVDRLFPEYQMWTQFLTKEYASAMNPDALASSHPIEVPVNAPSEVEEIFDAISYCKGASIIRMLHSWIGDDAFRRGMNQYLTKFQYKNARTEDLWEALEKASGKPVGHVMGTWTVQMGFPVLTIEDKQEGSNRVLTVSQEKFCADGNIAGFESAQWMVPITVATRNSSNALTFVLDKKTTSVVVENVSPEDWILANPGRVGYFRVNYSSSVFEKLFVALKEGQLGERDRLSIQEDASALAHVGIGRNTVDVLKLLKFYMNETSFTVWESVITEVGHTSFLLGYTDFHDLFKKYALSLFESVGAKVGWDPKESDSPLDVLLRSMVLQQRGFYGDQSVVAEARKRFDDHLHGRKEIAADLKSVVYGIVAYHGDETTYTQLLELLDKAESSDEKVRIYRVLGYMKSQELITKSLELGFSSKVRSQDTPVVCMSCLKNVIGRDILWEFMKKNWAMINNNYKGGFMLGRIVGIATSYFVTEEKATEIEQFFKANPCPVAERAVKQNCESIRIYAKWLKRDVPLVKEWLSSL
ncbi:hypothetical protein EMCRGX_G018741 [Ephydatia muelleri]